MAGACAGMAETARLLSPCDLFLSLFTGSGLPREQKNKQKTQALLKPRLGSYLASLLLFSIGQSKTSPDSKTGKINCVSFFPLFFM